MASETPQVERVGIRALQVNALAIVRRVAAGRRITVTDGGRPVARLVPWDAAQQQAAATPATRDEPP
ncbi:MAG TPA: type II toxin-antitoxin system prevent-host-death family antitoxin [Candidatus Dormibacteraeota bacterium]|nr:type II toxin-antitoxin system prevent-host-death family antitoxin [Candidatus Dormibacteraeota bacterium]